MIKAINKNVVLKKIEEKEKTVSGIVLSQNKNLSNIASVLSVGENCKFLKVDDKVVFSDNYVKVEHQNVEYYILNEEEVLARLED